MRYIFRIWNRSPNCALRRHSGLREGIISGIEIFAFLLHLRQDILVGWKLAILSKQLLLLRSQFAYIDFFSLSREHDELGIVME